MKKARWLLFYIPALILVSLFFKNPRQTSFFALAQNTEEKLQILQNQIIEYQAQIEKLKSQANTLANQIAQYDAQIGITSLKISETEEKIALLKGRIDQLEGSLERLTSAFSSRAAETYKMARSNDPLLLLFSSPHLGGALSRFHYLQKIQEADRELLVRLQTTQDTYKEEKEDQESLQRQLAQEKANLDSQKSAKANLLLVTKNDEKKYQQLLARAREEFEAIQAIIAGRGQETEAGKVSQGQKIASIIQGPSCNSSGAHLHFIVSQAGNAKNPFDYLKGGVDYENCSGGSCGSGGDSFDPKGSWDWPISPKISFNQGYGETWAVRNSWVGRIYRSHNGIDINSPSPEVKAVKSGTLYRGSYSGQGGCSLRYVRVDHDDSDLDTFYLHINY